MHIRITKAKGSDRVVIGDERVNVGEDSEVSDEFVQRLQKEFPQFTFEVTQADGLGDGNGEQGGDAGDGDDTDDEKSGDEA